MNYLRRISLLILLACAGVLTAQAQTWGWARSAGSPNHDQGNGVATDAAGNVFVTGVFRYAEMTFNTPGGPVTLINQGIGDIFLAKYDIAGTALWAMSFGANLNDVGRRVVTDDAGNVYVTGEFASSVLDFGNGVTLTNAYNGDDAFLVKFDNNGVAQWARSLTGQGHQRGKDVVVTNCGVSIIGMMAGASPFVSGTSTFLNNNGPAPSNDVFICSFDLNGNLIWADNYGDNFNDEGLGLATDGDHLFATGHFWGSIPFGGTTLNSSGQWDGWVTSMDCADGAVNWARRMGGTKLDYMYDVTYSANADKVYVLGRFNSPAISLPGFPITLNPGGLSQTAMVFALDAPGGTGSWLRLGTGSQPVNPHGIEADGCGNVYAVGRFSNPGINFTGTTLTATANNYNFYITKYNANTGTVIWADHVPITPGTTPNPGAIPQDVAINPSNNPVVTGDFRKSLLFSNGDQIDVASGPISVSDMFVAQMAENPNAFLTINPNGPFCFPPPAISDCFINLSAGPSGGIGFWSCPTAPGALSSTVTVGSHTNTFNWCLAGPGTHCIKFTRYGFSIPGGLSGCPSMVTECIEVFSSPTVSTTSPPAICVSDGPLDLAPYVNPTGGTFDQSPPYMNGSIFDPAVSGPGVFNISYSFTDPSTGCVGTGIVSVTVNDGCWHQHTVPQGGDKPQDVTTDSDGNVYFTGYFRNTTTIQDNFGNAYPISTTGQLGMFVAKYDACGYLKWVNYTSTDRVLGFGVTVDEASDMVYVVGEIQGDAQFEDYCGTNPIILPGLAGFVAQYDRNSGCLLFAENVTTGQFSIPYEADSWNGNLYITGKQWANIGGLDYIPFVHKYTPTSGSLGGAGWFNIGNPIYFSPFHTGWDIAVDASVSGSERVLITGDFNKALQFQSNTGQIIASTAQIEAFYAEFDEGTGVNTDLRQAGAASIPGTASGTGIAVDDFGNVFLTGSYRNGGLTNPFGQASLPGSAQSQAYVVGFGPGITGWSAPIVAAGGDVSSWGVATRDDRVLVTGTFTNGTLSAGGTVPYVSAAGPEKAYVTAYKIDGSGLWANATASPGNAYTHVSQGIACGPNERYYITGCYRGDVDYVTDNSCTGPLPYSSILAGFIIRGEGAPGDFSRLGGPAEALEAEVTEMAVKVWPNPGNGQFSLELTGCEQDSRVELGVYDMYGRLVYKWEGIAAALPGALDLQGQVAGNYVLRLHAQGETRSMLLRKL